jgi:hypothetical protein
MELPQGHEDAVDVLQAGRARAGISVAGRAIFPVVIGFGRAVHVHILYIFGQPKV